MKNVNRFSYHRFSLYFRLEISDLHLAASYTHSYVPYAYKHTHTKSAAKLQKIFEFCKYFDKKISEKCNIDHKRAIFTTCIDQSWAIFHPLHRPYMGDISQQKRLSNESLFVYPEPGSNRHGLLHWCLRPARLPIPPSGLAFGKFAEIKKGIACNPEKGGFLRNPTGCRRHPVQVFSYRRPLKRAWTCAAPKSLAEKGGFEPPVRLPVRQFSKLLV